MLLLHRNATLTVCHSRTRNLPEVVRQADILIAAVGRAEMVRGDWLKPGAVVIDVGVNAKDDENDPRGYRLVGDVNYAEAMEVASAVTPVPGGVGPMTIAMLLRNTTDSAARAFSER
jgi:5,10-methylene-tetrahydrofolate dehydrogenase/methenyl tetrahydrofolate cyclohydrolase